MRILFAPILLAVAGAACSHAIPAGAIQDAQLGARVKTALVNDAQLGIHPIEVRAIGGVVRLTGHVESPSQIERAVSLTRSVPGVAGVISDLKIAVIEALPPPATDDQQGMFIEEEREPHLIAVGISVGRSMPSEGGLGNHVKIGPLVRLGTGSGLGPAIGFGWFHADWRAGAPGSPVMGRIRVRPMMGGLAYGFRGERKSLSVSLIGGLAFNSLSLPAVITERTIPLSIGNSFAVRPGVALWFDVSRRIAVTVGGSYLMTRPRVQLLEDGEIRTRSLRADALLINTGIVYKIF